jgi:hypothetical protein
MPVPEGKTKQKEARMGNFSKISDTFVWKWPCLYFYIVLVKAKFRN